MKLFRILILVVALGAGGIAAYLALNLGPEAPAGPTVVELAPQIQSQDVLVAASDIGQGQKLTAENVRWQRWPEEAINPGYIQKQTTPDAVEKLKGSVVRSQFIAGEPIRESKLAHAGSGFMSAILPPGKRAIAVRVSAQNTAGGFILPNDRVDVIQTVSQQASPDSASENVSRTILTNVKVLAVDQTVDEQPAAGAEGAEGAEGAVVVGKTATLELDPEQAELVTAAEASGTLSLALRSFADSGDKTVALAKPTPPPKVVAEEPKSSTVRIVRSGRVQELTLGMRRSAAPPAAGELPAYDPEAHCNGVAKAGGAFSETLFSSCLQQEQSSYDQLKSNWTKLPPEMRNRCDSVASAGPTPSYTILSGCVDQEQTASRDKQGRKFSF